MTAVRNPKDLLAGLLFIGFGLAFVLIALNYPIGTSRRMGPAYLPIIGGALLTLIGMATAARSFIRPGTPIGTFALKPLLLITIASVAFGAVLRSGGLVPAVALLVVLSAAASARFGWWTSLLSAALLAAFCVLVFTLGLGLPLPAFGPWFGG